MTKCEMKDGRQAVETWTLTGPDSTTGVIRVCTKHAQILAEFHAIGLVRPSERDGAVADKRNPHRRHFTVSS